MRALLIVDIQNDFMPGGALAVPNGDEILPLVNRLQTRFARILATQDWHPRDHQSFAANHPGRHVGDQVTVAGIPQILWPVHCVQESAGALFERRLDQLRIEKIFRKGLDPAVDSYSGFFDVAKQESTGLDRYLHDEGIDELYIVGVATDHCVKFTALDAVGCGFKTTVVLDACRGVDLYPGDLHRAIEEMRAAGVSLRTTAEVEFELDHQPGTRRFEGKYLRIVERGGWEFAERTNCDAVVALVAVESDELLLTEQYRIPLGRTVLELPAGLVGDDSNLAGEPLENAARRELLEETGYEATAMRYLATGPCSAGLSNEVVTFFLAEGLRRITDGGGIDGERIALRRLPLAGAGEWIRSAVKGGHCIDPKVYAALYLLGSERVRDAAELSRTVGAQTVGVQTEAE